MALQKTYSKFEVDFSDAYHRVESVRFHKSRGKVSIDLMIYVDADAAAADDRSKVLGSFHCYMDYDGESTDNFLTECYNYVKTLDEYDGCSDV